jgi:ferrous iron transport protein B
VVSFNSGSKSGSTPAILTWVFANIYIGDTSILIYAVEFLDPFGKMLGLDGYIMMAFILGLPANEIVFPILLMGYLSTGSLTEVNNLVDLKQIFLDHGWTWLTALNMMLFSLLHYPCGTTLLNIYKEKKVKNGLSLLSSFQPSSPLSSHSLLHKR